MTARRANLPSELDLALRHPAVGQVHGQLHREPDDLHPVEVLGRGQRRVARRHHRHRVAPAARWRLMSWT